MSERGLVEIQGAPNRGKKGTIWFFPIRDQKLRPILIPGGVLPMWWVIHMCRGFDPLFSLWQDRAQSFWGIFSHPPTPKRSFVVLKLPILTEFDLLGPKFHFSLDLFGSNFQRPAAHPHHFSERVPPPGPNCSFMLIRLFIKMPKRMRTGWVWNSGANCNGRLAVNCQAIAKGSDMRWFVYLCIIFPVKDWHRKKNNLAMNKWIRKTLRYFSCGCFCMNSKSRTTVAMC